MTSPMKILGWAIDHNGCGNYRVGLPMWALAEAGHDALAFSVLNMDVDESVDILVAQMINSEERTEQYRELVARPGRSYAVVFEIDDNLWRLADTAPGHTFYEGPAGELVARNIAMADAVTCTTEPLAEVVSAWNKNVFVLPNMIDGSLLEHVPSRQPGVTVGWAGGATHYTDFAFVQNDLKPFFRRNPSVDTHFIGMNFGAAIGRPDTRFTGWTANLTEYVEKLDFDIGIAPLAFHAFNRSKSDLKFLEYSALGITMVASDFGPYAATVQHGETGFLVRHPHEWSKYLRQLVNDDQLRVAVGQNAKKWVKTRTIQANWWRWEQVYRTVLGQVSESAIGKVA